MKIKEIVINIKSIPERIYIAYRINGCCDYIKGKIKELNEIGELPSASYNIVSPNRRGCAELTASELVHIYGMDNLSALLFLDDIGKADSKDNKTELNNLLNSLVSGKNRSRMAITDDMLEKVRRNSPSVWEQYQKICEEEEAKLKSVNAEYESIIENEL